MPDMPMLYSWGVVQFTVYPVNLTEADHITATDWARKEIAGAAIYREWVGEGDEEIHLRGKLFPHFYARMGGARSQYSRDISGVPTIEVLDNMRKLGQAHVLMRGDGVHLGWYVIERLSRAHAYLGMEGVGQQITFEATFMRVPVPDDPAMYIVNLYGVGSATGTPVVTGGEPPSGAG